MKITKRNGNINIFEKLISRGRFGYAVRIMSVNAASVCNNNSKGDKK